MIMILLLLVFLVPSFAWGQHPNEPTGSTTVLDEPWSVFNYSGNQLGTGWVKNYPQFSSCDGFLVSDNSAPMSGSSVLRQHRAAGSATGGCGLNYYYAVKGKTLYVDFAFKPSNPYWGVSARTTKVTGYMEQEKGSGHFIGFGMQSDGSGTSWTPLFWFNGSADNCHLRGQPGFYNPFPSECAQVYTFYPNVGGASITAGKWNRVQIILKVGTCQTCRDSEIHAWINGVKTHQFRGINLEDAPFSAWNLTHTWDGQGMECVSCESWLDFDHMYASIGGTIGTSNSDNPPGPPGPPTGVTVTVR